MVCDFYLQKLKSSTARRLHLRRNSDCAVEKVFFVAYEVCQK